MTTTLNPPVKSARKAKGDGHTRRSEILRAAERIFLAEGYEGATIRKIAEEVGVSSTCLYMHFRDKDEILLEICTSAIGQLQEISEAIAALPIDAVERLRRMLEAYVAFALDNPNSYRVVFCQAPGAPRPEAGGQRAHDLGMACKARFLGVVQEIAAEGRLRRGDPIGVHQAMWSACHGLATLRITKAELDWAPAEELTGLLVDGLLFGLVSD
ncbi:MAG TPA: TetR/AcrR family transcriptional regulator [Caulobacteraceae bacterium]|nr:TetR/AcrR family transcriptional regulator [Caulobacteraceae bacterium]